MTVDLDRIERNAAACLASGYTLNLAPENALALIGGVRAARANADRLAVGLRWALRCVARDPSVDVDEWWNQADTLAAHDAEVAGR